MGKLRDLVRGKAKRKPFSFKRVTADGEETYSVLIEVLLEKEIEDAKIAAGKHLEEKDPENKGGPARELLFDLAYTRECLARALKDPDDPDQPWASAEDIREILRNPEIGLLQKAYEEYQAQQSPTLSTLTKAQYEALKQAIAKEGSLDAFLLLPSSMRRACIISMARELVTLQAAKSSPTSGSAPMSTPESPPPSENAETTDQG